MALDGFTLIAQVVNFVLLLVLLRVFLFKPVQRVMHAREERIAEAHAAARRTREAAEQQSAQLAQERQTLRDQADARRAELDAELDRERARRLGDLRDEIEAARDAWRADLQREREALADAVREDAATVLGEALRRGWEALADQDLEARAIEVFAHRVAALGEEQRRELAAAARTGPVRFATAFEVDAVQRTALLDAVRTALAVGDRGVLVDATFERDPELLAGVAMRAGDLRVQWSVRAQIEDVERAWRTAEVEA